MGLFFHTSSWRKPLQLIECWLPEPALAGQARSVAPVAASAPLTPTVRRFARAGWLGRPAANQAMRRAPHDGRVAVAGRIDDVCRKLDRLVDDESRLRRRAAR